MNRDLCFHQLLSTILRDCLCLCTFIKGCDVWRTAKVGSVCQLALAWAALWTQLDSRSQWEGNNYRLKAIMTPFFKMQRQLVELRIIIYALSDTEWRIFSLKTPIKTNLLSFLTHFCIGDIFDITGNDIIVGTPADSHDCELRLIHRLKYQIIWPLYDKARIALDVKSDVVTLWKT